MEWLWLALPGLACAAMMLFVCVPMMFGKKHGCNSEAATKQEVNALREEIAALQAGTGSAAAGTTPSTPEQQPSILAEARR